MKVSIAPIYTAIACNRTPEIVDWNSNGLICFGAAHAVIIYDTLAEGGDSHKVLSHHLSKVNSVKWLNRCDGDATEVISCSADKTAAIWTLENGKWKLSGTLIGHTDGVTCIHGIYGTNSTNGNDLLLYTGSIDSTIRIWERTNGTITEKQIIHLNSGLCLSLHAHMLPVVNKPVLFTATDDHKIHIYCGEAEYHKVHSLVGHEDWVRGLDAMNIDNSTIMLASASQDTYIRLWRIQLHDETHVSGDDSTIKVEQKLFEGYQRYWSVKLDAVLAGHEGWVYGVQWHPYKTDKETKKKEPVYRLLSSSLDKTLIIWEPDSSSTLNEGEGVWVEKVRVGEVGGNGLGFYGSRFGPDGKSFLGHGYNGSFHIWKLNEETSQWISAVVPGGHFAAVEDVRWEPQGRYIMSVSADQTTRVHAPWKRANGVTEWHELARPQVHGYDMSSLALIDAVTLASSAEEKVIRVFRAPYNFVENFFNITGVTIADQGERGPEGASVPSLGLSNKAVFAGDESKEEAEDNSGYFVPIHLKEPPTEENLMQNTLWPETNKLYGHGYEVYTLDASPDGTLLASACKATSAEHAAVILWETKNWQQIQKLVSHQLTVTQLAFSPDSQRLLSVSRDRRWTLYHRREGTNLFDMSATTDKKNGVHSRIIWCCAWSHDSLIFGTGSRDGKVCLWTDTETPTQSSLNQYTLLGKPLEIPNASVTALAFSPVHVNDTKILSIGLESGIVRIYGFKDIWEMLYEMDNSTAHHLTVRRLTFKPESEEKDLLLASCGSDHLVRVYSVSIS